MSTNKISFLNYRQDRVNSDTYPVPSIKVLPSWYKKMPKYVGENLHPDSLTNSTVKNCVPFFDAMSCGYMLVTPCDIYLYEQYGIPCVKIKDDRYLDFVGERNPLDNWPENKWYHKHHFHWLLDWGIKLPEGYSALYTSPLNMYDLPFLTSSGIMDNDKTSIYGQIPFFVKVGTNTLIPKGTPFIQIILIKREEWQSDIKILSQDEVNHEVEVATQKYRSVDSDGYRNLEWERKSYE